jgi:hypothetical protein
VFRILYSLFVIVHAMACLPPAVDAHPSGRIGEDPSGILNNLFPSDGAGDLAARQSLWLCD